MSFRNRKLIQQASLEIRPTNYQGSLIWLDSSDKSRMTINSGRVTNITDKKNSFLFNQDTAGQRPTWDASGFQSGLPGFVFTGAENWTCTVPNYTNASEVTLFYVIKPLNASGADASYGRVFNNGGYWGVGGVTSNFLGESLAFIRVADRAGLSASDYFWNAGETHVVCITQNTTEIRFWKNFNNLPISLGTNGNFTPGSDGISNNTFQIGNTTSGSIVGTLGDVLVYTSELSDSQRLNVTSFLMKKFNLLT